MDSTYQEALDRFRDLFERARETELLEPAAMTLATVGDDGQVSARVVLLRAFDERGFVFYTNLQSVKSRQITQHANVALCLHWDPLRQQVRIEGSAEPVSDEEADAYWASRPRGSQIGAWASRQSSELASRAELEQAVADVEQRFAEQGQVPRPDFWSGFRVVPRRIEFWQARESRLHDRVVFEQSDGEWGKKLLSP